MHIHQGMDTTIVFPVLHICTSPHSKKAERENKRSGKTDTTTNGDAIYKIIKILTGNIMFQMFDDNIFLADNVVYQIANRYQSH